MTEGPLVVVQAVAGSSPVAHLHGWSPATTRARGLASSRSDGGGPAGCSLSSDALAFAQPFHHAVESAPSSPTSLP